MADVMINFLQWMWW